ncbi:MAG: DUF6263 family protein [Gemmatimonadota bacterium]
MNRLLLLVLTIASISACGDRGVPSEVRLRLEYEEGDTLLYEYHIEGTMTVADTSEVSGRATHPYVRNMTVEEAVRDVTPRGNYVLAWTFHLPSDFAAAESTAELPVPVQLTVEITPQGRILSIGGVETARSLFGEIDFQSYFEQNQPVFPDRPLKVGDSWTQEVKVVSPLSEPVVTSSTYVLERVEEEEGEPVAVIAFDGDIYLPSPYRPAGADSTAETTAEERIRVKGKMFFALESGRMLRAEAEADATLTRIEIEGGEPVRREIQFRQSSRYELVRP